MMMQRRHLLAMLAAGAFAGPARAQAKYPDRPVRLLVPFGPGGLADVTARVVGEKMAQSLGQQVVIVNTPGAGGIAAAKAALAAAPDGYTLILFTNGTAISVPLVKELGYDPLTQFVPVSSLGFFDFLLLTNAELPHRSLGDFLAAAKAKPGSLNVATINVGSTQNLSAVLFKSLAGVDFTIVPYRTTPEALTALLRKDVDLVFDGYVAAKGMMQDGKLRALASSGPARFSGLPEVPTVIESGVPGFDVTSWNAIYAPAGTSPEIVRTLNGAILAALGDAGVVQKLKDLGIEAKGGAPADIDRRLREDIGRWGAVISKAGIAKQ